MLKEILKECIAEMMEDPMYLFTEKIRENFIIKSYTLKKLGKGVVYCCEILSSRFSDKVFYVEESRVKKKIEEKRNIRIDEILES